MPQFLEYDPLPIIHAVILSTASSAATRSKAMYCLSATLKHSHIALKRFDELEGWSVLNKSLNGALAPTFPLLPDGEPHALPNA